MSADGNWCIRTEEDTNNGVDACIMRKDLDEVEKYVNSVSPRLMLVAEDTNYIIPYTLEEYAVVKAGTILKFTTKILSADGNWCIRTEEDTDNGVDACITRSALKDL